VNARVAKHFRAAVQRFPADPAPPKSMYCWHFTADAPILRNDFTVLMLSPIISVVLNLFHCWDPLNATDVIWDPQVKIEKVCAPE